ncbi:hypothetical protein GCM10023192_42370 [Amycolatopsis samaneae]
MRADRSTHAFVSRDSTAASHGTPASFARGRGVTGEGVGVPSDGVAGAGGADGTTVPVRGAPLPGSVVGVTAAALVGGAVLVVTGTAGVVVTAGAAVPGTPPSPQPASASVAASAADPVSSRVHVRMPRHLLLRRPIVLSSW